MKTIKKGQFAIGLDIGTTKIVVMVGRKVNGNKFEVLAVGNAMSHGVKGGMVRNLLKTTESIKDAVQKAEEQIGQKIDEVFVGIAGHHIRSIQHTEYITRENPEEIIGDADIKRLEEAIRKINIQPGEEIIHVIPQEFSIDGDSGVVEPQGMNGYRLEGSFHVVIGQSIAIKNIANCIAEAGLKLKGITLEPIASSEAVLEEDEKEAGVALVDIGGGTTDIAIFKGGIIRHTFVIPIGGNIITEDIKEGCSLLWRYAEHVKRGHGSAWPGGVKENEFVTMPPINKGGQPHELSIKKLSYIIYARVEELFNIVLEQIQYYEDGGEKTSLNGGIVLTGGGASLKDIKQLLAYMSGKNVRIGYPTEYIVGENSDYDVKQPLYATVVGLMIESDKYIDETTFEVENKEPKVNFVSVEVDETTSVEESIEGNHSIPSEEVDKSKPAKNKRNYFSFLQKYTKVIKNYIETDDEYDR